MASFYRSSEFHFISLYSAVSQKIFFISSYTEKNNYVLLYELMQDLPYGRLIIFRRRSTEKVLIFIGSIAGILRHVIC